MMLGRWFGGWSYGPFYGWGWLGMLINILIFAAVIYLVYRFLGRCGLIGGCCSGNGTSIYGTHVTTENAEDILRQRYAKGEITREQFVQMLDDLKG